MTEPRRETLKRLIVDAERLMSRARLESEEIVENAEQRARSLVDAATELYRSAEAEAAQIREAADRYRSEAEADAGVLRETARSDHRRAIDEARRVVEASPGRATSTGGAGEDLELQDTERLLQEAVDKADRILRVARSEATARADEMLEAARRRISQMEEDARRRNETAASEHREIQRRLRGEQLELKTRIAELREEVGAAERRRREPTVETRLSEAPMDVASPEPATSAPEGVEAPQPTFVERALSVSTPEPRVHGRDEDSDYGKAIRRFRRRA